MTCWQHWDNCLRCKTCAKRYIILRLQTVFCSADINENITYFWEKWICFARCCILFYAVFFYGKFKIKNILVESILSKIHKRAFMSFKVKLFLWYNYIFLSCLLSHNFVIHIIFKAIWWTYKSPVTVIIRTTVEMIWLILREEKL